MTRVVYLGVVALALVAGCQTAGGDGCGCAACSACGCGGCDACGGCEACGGCGCGGGGQASSADARHAGQLTGRYRGWTRANDTQFKSRTHGNHMIHDYVNPLAKSTFARGEGAYPVGAVVVKEGWKKGKRNMTWIMEKRSAGYDAAHGDWWYAEITAKGTVTKAGKVAACIDCHDRASNDYVYGVP